MMKMKWIPGIFAISFSIMLAYFPAVAEEIGGEPFNLKISNNSAERGNVTVTLEEATAERMSNPDRYEYTLSGTIENGMDEGIMQVIYSFAFYDENGEEYRSFG